MQKEFLTYEMAKLLKELGFNSACVAYYSNQKVFNMREYFHGWVNLNDRFVDEYSDIIAAPLFQQVVTWLRNEHDIHLQIVMHSWMDRTYCFKLHWKDAYIDSSKLLYPGPIIGEYEDVLEKGLIQSINKVKFKK